MLTAVAISALALALACVAHAFLVFSSARAESETILKQHAQTRPDASDPPAHTTEIPRMFASRTGRGSLVIALLALLLAAAAAAVHEKVASAHPETERAGASGTTALTGMLADLTSFAGRNSFHSGPIDKSLCLVQYFDGARQVGSHRSHNWWTSCQQAQHLSTIDAVRTRLALPPDWGGRDRRQFAFVPRGANVAYIVGRAAPQLSKRTHRRYPGGGGQFRVLGFKPAWLGRVECPSSADETVQVHWHRC